MIKKNFDPLKKDFFDDWDWEPLGAASLAQCHRAKLKSNGQVVAVKVQHAPVKHTAHLDMMLMEFGVLQAAQVSFLFEVFFRT